MDRNGIGRRRRSGIVTCQRNGVDPFANLREVLARLPATPIGETTGSCPTAGRQPTDLRSTSLIHPLRRPPPPALRRAETGPRSIIALMLIQSVSIPHAPKRYRPSLKSACALTHRRRQPIELTLTTATAMTLKSSILLRVVRDGEIVYDNPTVVVDTQTHGANPSTVWIKPGY